MLLIVAVAFAAMSCGNKCCQKSEECCQKDSAAVEVVAEEAAEEAPAEAAEVVEAPAEAE